MRTIDQILLICAGFDFGMAILNITNRRLGSAAMLVCLGAFCVMAANL